MAEAPQVVEIDPDFEPLPRPRSCTWPLPRPEFSQSNSATSSPAPSGGAAANPDAAAGLPPASAAAVNADFMSNLSLLEESEDFPQAPGSVAAAAAAAAAVAAAAAAAATGGLCGDFQGAEAAGCLHPAPPQPPAPGPLSQHPPVPPAAAGPLAGQPRKSSSSRRNAWGNLSYADLITKAIESSAEKRLTLSQIYEWMVKSVPYFKDKGDSNSSAGWKVSGRTGARWGRCGGGWAVGSGRCGGLPGRRGGARAPQSCGGTGTGACWGELRREASASGTGRQSGQESLPVRERRLHAERLPLLPPGPPAGRAAPLRPRSAGPFPPRRAVERAARGAPKAGGLGCRWSGPPWDGAGSAAHFWRPVRLWLCFGFIPGGLGCGGPGAPSPRERLRHVRRGGRRLRSAGARPRGAS